MFKEKIKEFEERVNVIEDNFECYYNEDPDFDNESFENEVQELKEEIETYLEIETPSDNNAVVYNEKRWSGVERLKKLLKRVIVIEKEININNFGYETFDDWYDGELDRMFPDRHDDDFDEDSMSYDSVFGDD